VVALGALDARTKWGLTLYYIYNGSALIFISHVYLLFTFNESTGKRKGIICGFQKRDAVAQLARTTRENMDSPCQSLLNLQWSVLFSQFRSDIHGDVCFGWSVVG
jgi:hypothetical protein